MENKTNTLQCLLGLVTWYWCCSSVLCVTLRLPVSLHGEAEVLVYTILISVSDSAQLTARFVPDTERFAVGIQREFIICWLMENS